ncbi:MAG: DUF4493 domain-containing protein [Bacteroidales bacterium]|nr:DUF4493 domain-containing protein [Bacteroidales bacterium]
MKKNIIIAFASAALVLFASCQKTPISAVQGVGTLSFSEFTLGLDETVETKAVAASGNYTITIFDSEGNEVEKKTYDEVKNNDYKLTLTAGSYTLVASSSADEVPLAAFEQPVYGVSKEFTIAAGMTTSIGELVCTLQQCKVTVSYSDDFLKMVTGQCSTKVTVDPEQPLEYALNADKTYEQSAGYFAVTGSTMTVVFKGDIEGGSKSMTKVFSNIAPKQWRQIKFIPKVDEEGNATFDIVIQDLISDATLNNAVDPKEEIIGEDPDAPKGDGGITLAPDYEAGCDSEITDLENILIVPVATRDMAIRFRATVPNGVKKFNVLIDSDNESFLSAVDAANARELDLINPLPENGIIFDVVPFPHGQELLGQTDIAFNLDAAQDAITIYSGRHTFKMIIVDQTGCKNEIPVVMVVE